MLIALFLFHHIQKVGILLSNKVILISNEVHITVFQLFAFNLFATTDIFFKKIE